MSDLPWVVKVSSDGPSGDLKFSLFQEPISARIRQLRCFAPITNSSSLIFATQRTFLLADMALTMRMPQKNTMLNPIY